MTTRLKAHFDGNVLVPDQPVDLPIGCPLEVEVSALTELSETAKMLLEMARIGAAMPDNPDTPVDGAEQIDHYLYGMPKKP